MAFSTYVDNLQKVAGSGGNSPSIFTYKTGDGLTTVDGAGYFNAAGGVLKLGDIIFTTVVTNIDTSSEAFSAAGITVVNSRSLSAGDYTIDVANHVSLATIDSD